MGLPNTYKKNINAYSLPANSEYPQSGIMKSAGAEAMKDLIVDKSTYLPNGVLHYDLDKGFKDFVTKDLEIVIDNKKVPVIMLSLQKWNEFTDTWELVNENQAIEMPFVTIVRQPNTRPGTNENLLHNIPGNLSYYFAEVPTWDGNRKGVDLYKIPMPTPIDILYQLRIFTTRQTDLNVLNKKVMKAFRSLQAYTLVNGHYIPMLLEDDSDESQVSNTQERRFFVHLYNFTLQGFILDPEDFTVVPAINRILLLNS
jgi:hypothetical protein